MSLARIFFFGIISLAIVGCQTIPAESTQPQLGSCDAANYEHLKWTSAAELNRDAFPANTRFIQPGMAVTMDFRKDRLNFKIGKTNRVEHIYCG
jgi:hypothetical protein